LLETNWVLRSLYGFDESAIRDAFTKLLGLDNVETEDTSSVAAALALTAHGIEFADAMHLGSRPVEAVFVSFDKAFVQRAKRAGVSDISGISGRPLPSTPSLGSIAPRRICLLHQRVDFDSARLGD
jgi:hypothetical protein